MLSMIARRLRKRKSACLASKCPSPAAPAGAGASPPLDPVAAKDVAGTGVVPVLLVRRSKAPWSGA